MEARIVREELQKCQKAEGVNHYQVCHDLAQKYMDLLKDAKVRESYRNDRSLDHHSHLAYTRSRVSASSTQLSIPTSTLAASIHLVHITCKGSLQYRFHAHFLESRILLKPDPASNGILKLLHRLVNTRSQITPQSGPGTQTSPKHGKEESVKYAQRSTYHALFWRV